ncbi:hypothetical protein L208DRAFT_1236797 [Tricholoma matsutake]|nr:hypothetical protein L208DRAFT_1236797 [Tricholoma matsutake 945]
MATMTMSHPLVSSPLADSSDSSRTAAQHIVPRRNPTFQSSCAVCPFPSISHTLQPTSSTKKVPVELIVPLQSYRCTFVLDLTQAEFSRQD